MFCSLFEIVIEIIKYRQRLSIKLRFWLGSAGRRDAGPSAPLLGSFTALCGGPCARGAPWFGVGVATWRVGTGTNGMVPLRTFFLWWLRGEYFEGRAMGRMRKYLYGWVHGMKRMDHRPE